MSLPENFKCVITNWDYIYRLCRKISKDVRSSGYKPDVIVALARGGWFAGRVLCDFLDLNDLISLKIEHYTGTANASSGPRIRYPIDEKMIKGKNVLIVDDISDTGKSMMFARDYISKYGPREVRTATLQHLMCSQSKADYVGELLDEWAWVIFPWNFMEDMCDVTSQVMAKNGLEAWTMEDIKMGLKKHHQIEPTYLEISQPGRLEEVLEEMEYRGLVRALGGSVWEPVKR
jgi:hypoxanthine phosphoribosyltransferase